MAQYISLLRGINVSGQKKITMKELESLYQLLGFTHIQTYIQSGNVIFQDHETSNLKLSQKIETGIKQKFGFEVKVLVKTPQALQNVLLENPLGEERTFITFLAQIPRTIPFEELNKARQGLERFVVTGDIIYFSCPGSYGKSKLSNNFFEAKMKVPATTRNWKTVYKLWELAAP